MASYERKFSGIGSDVDRELAAAWTQVNNLTQTVARLTVKVGENAELLRVLKKSQATRDEALRKSRAREADLRRQLEKAGVAPAGPESTHDGITYLGQQRASQRLTGPQTPTKGER